ncbi:endonuclease [Rummeliibacillus pycnus]
MKSCKYRPFDIKRSHRILHWNEQDPVSEWERQQNEKIYNIQTAIHSSTT